MQKLQKGFTLIELIVVIVLLGILGVTALANFQDLSADATTAANEGIAAEISAASNINYAAALIGTPDAVIDGTNAAECVAATTTALLTGGLPGEHVIGAGVGDCAAIGDTITCAITATSLLGTAGTATLVCTD
jgi:prepilin-type N-terminal cleavage/methylation domain-containing protein